MFVISKCGYQPPLQTDLSAGGGDIEGGETLTPEQTLLTASHITQEAKGEGMANKKQTNMSFDTTICIRCKCVCVCFCSAYVCV